MAEGTSDLLGESWAGIEPWLRQYGYWVLVFALASEGVIFSSMIVPGLLVLILAGFWAGQGYLDVRVLLLVAVPSVWLGDAISYFIGRFFWRRLLGRTRLGQAVARFQPVLEHRGRAFLVFYHFEPMARMLGATAAGAAGLSVRAWLPYDFLGAALWVTFYAVVGFVLGRSGHAIDDWEALRPISVVALVLLGTWLWLLSRAIKRFVAPEPGSP